MTKAANRLRSAKAPVMSAGVIAANISWKVANRTNGIVLPSAGSRPTLAKPMKSRPPNRPAPVASGAKASREADEDPDDAHEGEPEEAVHDRREDVLAADEAAVEERKPRQHDHDEGRRDEQPGGVPGVHDPTPSAPSAPCDRVAVAGAVRGGWWARSGWRSMPRPGQVGREPVSAGTAGVTCPQPRGAGQPWSVRRHERVAGRERAAIEERPLAERLGELDSDRERRIALAVLSAGQIVDGVARRPRPTRQYRITGSEDPTLGRAPARAGTLPHECIDRRRRRGRVGRPRGRPTSRPRRRPLGRPSTPDTGRTVECETPAGPIPKATMTHGVSRSPGATKTTVVGVSATRNQPVAGKG